MFRLVSTRIRLRPERTATPSWTATRTTSLLTDAPIVATRHVYQPIRTLSIAGDGDSSTIGSRDQRIQLLAQMSQHIEQGNARAAEELLRHVNLSQVDAPILLYNRILMTYADLNQLYDLKRVFASLLKDPALPTPDEHSYNVYLKALPLKQAEALLRQMMKRRVAQTTSFNTLIAKYCREGRPNEAAQVLQQMVHKYDHVQPDLFSFSPILRVLAQRGQPQQAEALFEAMQDRSIAPDNIAWSSLIHAWATSKQPEAPDRVKQLLIKIESPDAAIYNTVLLAFANATDRAAEAHELMRTMTLEPNVITYSTLLLAYRNSPNIPGAVERAKELLETMRLQGLEPNVIFWTTLIAIYGRENMVDSAEEVLQNMASPPNVVTYTAVLDAWAQSEREDAFGRAMALFESMKHDTTVQPNVTTYNTLLKVIEKCPGVTDKVAAIQEVRSIMAEDTQKPNIRTYNAIFAACAAASAKKDNNNQAASLECVLETLQELRSTLQRKEIDNYTYPAIFKALVNLQAPFRVLRVVFGLCVQDQAFSRMVVSHLRRSCSKAELQQLIPMVKDVHDFDMNEVPTSWRPRHERGRRK